MHKLVLVVAAAALSLTACSAAPEPTGSPNPVPTTATPSSTATNGSSTGISVSGDLGSKPEVTLPSGFGNVENLVVEDVVVGNGAAVQADDQVTVHYVGIGATTGQQFDSSWDAGMTASFPLNQVILGWQQGLVGMQVGGRRLLVIPGALAYGPNAPAGSGIEPNETLVFVVDLISIP